MTYMRPQIHHQDRGALFGKAKSRAFELTRLTFCFIACLRDLQDTWQQLVGAGILTDAEFWRGHQDLLQGAPAASRQRTGFSTAMIGDVRQGSEGSTDRVRARSIPHQCNGALAQCPG